MIWWFERLFLNTQGRSNKSKVLSALLHKHLKILNVNKNKESSLAKSKEE